MKNDSTRNVFEGLGFIKNTSICYDEQHILYEKAVMDETDILFVEFKNGYVIYTNTARNCLKIYPDILKAINKQCQ